MFGKKCAMPMGFLVLFAFYALFANQEVSGEFLQVQGTNFMYRNQRVFLSGVNIAWIYYGWDFGNGNWANTRARYEQWLGTISASGGNTIRIWLHIEAESTPAFDANGFVTAPDSTGQIIGDLGELLTIAERYNIFVVFTLWNGALIRNDRYRNLITNDAILTSYINNALTPMVAALANYPALATWEVMNEPEGSVLIAGHAEPCHSTTNLAGTGAGWTGSNIPMLTLQRFINRQAGAIKRADHSALVAVGSWSEHGQNNVFPNGFNYYTQRCLELAGGDPLGAVDYYQMHTYSWEGNWNTNSPFRRQAADFQLDKPLVIGEFSSVCAMNEGINALWGYAFDNGYDGVWSWQYNLDNGHCQDSQAAQNQGMNFIRNRPGVPVIIS